jgi:hypothetical protein
VWTLSSGKLALLTFCQLRGCDGRLEESVREALDELEFVDYLPALVGHLLLSTSKILVGSLSMWTVARIRLQLIGTGTIFQGDLCTVSVANIAGT